MTTTGPAQTTTASPETDTPTPTSTAAPPTTTAALTNAPTHDTLGTVVAAAVPVGAAVALVLLAELVLLGVWLRRRGKGHLVLGIDVTCDGSVLACLMNSRHTTAQYSDLVDTSSRPARAASSALSGAGGADEESRLVTRGASDEPIDVRIAHAIADAFRSLQPNQHGATSGGGRLAAIAVTAPGTSVRYGLLTHGCHPRIVECISAAVKAKAVIADTSNVDSSLEGIRVFAPSAALAAGCAVTYRVQGDRARRMTAAPTVHLALHVSGAGVTCAVFTVQWERRHQCLVRVIEDFAANGTHAMEPLDLTQLSAIAVSGWARRALRPMVHQMLAVADDADGGGHLDVPLAMCGPRAQHPAILEELSGQARLRVWYPHRHEAVATEGVLAFGAAALAAGGLPSAQVAISLSADSVLVPGVGAPPAPPTVPVRGSGNVNQLPSYASTTGLSEVYEEQGLPGSVGSSLRGSLTRHSALAEESGVDLSSVGSCVSHQLMDTPGPADRVAAGVLQNDDGDDDDAAEA